MKLEVLLWIRLLESEFATCCSSQSIFKWEAVYLLLLELFISWFGFVYFYRTLLCWLLTFGQFITIALFMIKSKFDLWIKFAAFHSMMLTATLLWIWCMWSYATAMWRLLVLRLVWCQNSVEAAVLYSLIVSYAIAIQWCKVVVVRTPRINFDFDSRAYRSLWLW